MSTLTRTAPLVHLQRRARRGATLAVIVAVAWPVAPTSGVGPAPAGAQDLDDVRDQVAELEEEVSASTAAYEEVWARTEEARTELAELSERAAALEREADEVAELLIARARRVYMRGSDSPLTMLMGADGPQSAVERASLVAMLASRDRTRLESVRLLRRQLGQARILQADKAAELDELQAEMDRHLADLQGDLEGARVLLADLETRAARQRRIDRGSQQGVYACIFDPPFHFRDTWGAPRSGGRRHKGTDVFSYYGAPVYAFTAGVIQKTSTSRLGGLGLYLSGDDGNLYYYAHLDSIAEAVRIGMRVEAGELVAYNGDSGNARGDAPHVHYQMHPGGGAPVNPYAWLAAACY